MARTRTEKRCRDTANPSRRLSEAPERFGDLLDGFLLRVVAVDRGRERDICRQVLGPHQGLELDVAERHGAHRLRDLKRLQPLLHERGDGRNGRAGNDDQIARSVEHVSQTKLD